MVRRWYLILLAVVFVAGLAGLRWGEERARRRASEAGVVLPDGSRLLVWRVTYGTQHVLRFGRWPRLDGWRQRHDWLTNWLGPVTAETSTRSDGDGVCVFYSTIRGDGTTDPDPAWGRAFRDEHGCEVGSLHSRGNSTFLGTNVLHQTSETYPRRQREFDMIFGNSHRTTNEIVVRLGNDRPWTGDEWPVVTLPVRATHGELGVVFERWGGSARWPAPKFATEFDGHPTREWQPYQTWYEDVTGNRAQGPHLCRRENAWRVTARFGRKPEAALGEGQVWTLLEGDLPADGEGVMLGATNVLEGVRVEAVALGGRGVATFASGGGWHLTSITNLAEGEVGSSFSTTNDGTESRVRATAKQPWVALNLTGLTPDHHWQVAVFDENGKVSVGSGWSSANRTFHLCELPAFGEPRRGRLKLVVQRYRDLVFMVPPPPPEVVEEGKGER